MLFRFSGDTINPLTADKKHNSARVKLSFLLARFQLAIGSVNAIFARFISSRILWSAVLMFSGAFAGLAQESTPHNYSDVFDKKEVMISARDGIKLHTEIYTPKGPGPFPIIFERTPYGISAPDKGYSRSLSRYADMIPEGYIFVFQDIRGRYGSEGQFVMNRPIHDPSDVKGVDESTDAYDTIDWLVKNVPRNNGRVGMDGISYDGFLVTMGMIHPHPALKAVSEQACMGDTFLGDDFFHNGAFRLSYGFEYAALLESSNENFRFGFDRFDVYDWYLRLGALSNANEKYFHGAIPTWNNFVAHNSYDEFWKKHAVAYGLKETTVPDLNVAGWWDQEDFYGPMFTYENLEKSDTKHLNYLVVGPWNHGGWGRGSGKCARRDTVWKRHRSFFSSAGGSPVVRLLVEGQRNSAAQGSVTFPDRQ